jgi:hypothetical protein
MKKLALFFLTLALLPHLSPSDERPQKSIKFHRAFIEQIKTGRLGKIHLNELFQIIKDVKQTFPDAIYDEDNNAWTFDFPLKIDSHIVPSFVVLEKQSDKKVCLILLFPDSNPKLNTLYSFLIKKENEIHFHCFSTKEKLFLRSVLSCKKKIAQR